MRLRDQTSHPARHRIDFLRPHCPLSLQNSALTPTTSVDLLNRMYPRATANAKPSRYHERTNTMHASTSANACPSMRASMSASGDAPLNNYVVILSACFATKLPAMHCAIAMLETFVVVVVSIVCKQDQRPPRSTPRRASRPTAPRLTASQNAATASRRTAQCHFARCRHQDRNSPRART